jgi:hypothetical protein
MLVHFAHYASFTSGIIGDKLGLRLSSIIFGSLVISGAWITAIGGSLKDVWDHRQCFYMMLGGRIVFG